MSEQLEILAPSGVEGKHHLPAFLHLDFALFTLLSQVLTVAQTGLTCVTAIILFQALGLQS